MTRISDLSALTGAAADTAADLLPIVDMSEAGAARNKKITLAEFFLAIRELVDDRMDAVLVEGDNVTLTYDDGAGTITIDATPPGPGDITGFNEAVDDRVAALLQEGTNITLTYNDGAGTLTIDAAGGGSSASTTQDDEMIAGFIASPSDKSYKIAVKMAHAGTITETTTISASGTCTATFKVNSTALGGTANSVSSAEQSQAHASTNTFVAGDDIVLTVSSNSSCADMSFSIKYTRTLD